VNGSSRSDEAHQKRRRLLYIAAELKNCSDGPCIRSNTISKGIAKTRRIALQDFKKIYWLRKKSDESVKVQFKKIVAVGAGGNKSGLSAKLPVY